MNLYVVSRWIKQALKKSVSLSLATIIGMSSLAMATPLLFPASVSAAPLPAVVYDATPSSLPPNVASLGFQATSTSEFGDYIHLGGTNRVLNTVNVTMSDWALASTPANVTFCSNNPSSCPQGGFIQLITLKIYSSHLGANGVPDTLLARKTQSVTVPWRQEADPTCANPTAWRAGDGNCYNGLAFNVPFDLSSSNATLPNDVIASVSYSTQSYGADPIGADGPYNSLNVGIPTGQTSSVGSDDSSDAVFIATSGGVFKQDTGWTPNGTVAFQITATALDNVYVDSNYTVGNAGGHTFGFDAFNTIQAGINAVSSGGTVNVAAGTYSGSLSLDKAVTLVGASSTFIVGQITVNSSGASISGFDISNPSGANGVLINHVGSVSVSGNNIHNVGSATTGANDYGVWFQSSGTTDASDITVSNNTISAIGSPTNPKTSSGIGIGDSSSHMNITSGLVISGNIIFNINSSTKGAYGVLLNLGASTALAADTASISGASITGNDISALTGAWEHAIGLETNTPSAAVTSNTVHNLSNASDVQAVHFEKNPGAATVGLTGTTFNGKSLVGTNLSVVVNSSTPTVPSSAELNTYPEFLLGNTYQYGGLNAFTTISAAVNGVAIGGTVHVASGTYDGFSVVGKTGVSIVGAGATGAGSTIIAPTALIDSGTAHKYTSDMLVSVLVKDSTGITIQGLTIKDNGLTPGSGGPDALLFWDASSGTIQDSNITGTYAINGVQTGQGIALDASGTENASLTVNNVAISGFQKNGIDVINGNGTTSGATGTVTLTVTGGSVTGAGSTSAIAQNGIVLWDRGGGTVTGTINGASISDFIYAPGGDSATDILVYGSASLTSVSHSSLVNADYLIDNETSNLVDASTNWWGHALGPNSAQTSDNITVSPWCSDDACINTQASSSGTTTLPVNQSADLSGSQSGNSATVPDTNDVVLSSSTSSATTTISGGTTVTASGGTGTWDGTIDPPTITSASVPPVAGMTTTVTSAIEIGSTTFSLSFDSPVELIFPGAHGQLVGFVRNGVFTRINEVCSGSSPAISELVANASGACYTTSGLDLVVWTSHFTTFVTYTQTATPPASSGSGSSSTGSSKPATSTPTTTSTEPANSEVLGTSTNAGVIGTALSTVAKTKVASAAKAKNNAWEWLAVLVVVLLVAGSVFYVFKLTDSNSNR